MSDVQTVCRCFKCFSVFLVVISWRSLSRLGVDSGQARGITDRLNWCSAERLHFISGETMRRLLYRKRMLSTSQHSDIADILQTSRNLQLRVPSDLQTTILRQLSQPQQPLWESSDLPAMQWSRMWRVQLYSLCACASCWKYWLRNKVLILMTILLQFAPVVGPGPMIEAESTEPKHCHCRLYNEVSTNVKDHERLKFAYSSATGFRTASQETTAPGDGRGWFESCDSIRSLRRPYNHEAERQPWANAFQMSHWYALISSDSVDMPIWNERLGPLDDSIGITCRRSHCCSNIILSLVLFQWFVAWFKGF